MPVNPQRDLADALRRAQAAVPSHILRTRQLSRADRTLLQQRGFLVEIIKGWYALTTPQALPGDSTFWHLHFWGFVAAYLEARYRERYCLSAEHSLDLWTASTQAGAVFSRSSCRTAVRSSCIRTARACRPQWR